MGLKDCQGQNSPMVESHSERMHSRALVRIDLSLGCLGMVAHEIGLIALS
jgi:hypothetical protein